METLKKYLLLSPAVLGGVALCFFMNFFTIRCNDQKLASVSGYALVTGKGITVNNPMSGMGGEQNSQEEKKMPPNIWALATLILALAGIMVYFLNPTKKFLITAVLAFAAFVSLLLLKSTLLEQILKQESDADKAERVSAMISVVPEMGYYLALIGLASVGVFNALLQKESRPKEQPPD